MIRIVALLLLLIPCAVRAATITAASVHYSAVTNAIASAVDGDTVAIPAGSTNWPYPVIITKAITLQGAGATLDQNLRATNCSTVIANNSATTLIEWYLVANKTSRMSQIKFVAGTGTYIVMKLSGLNTDDRRMRVDHCVWDHCGALPIYAYTILGVFDHNTIWASANLMYECDDNSWNGTQDVDTYGNGSWADSEHYGTDQFMFFEDNNFVWDGSGTGATDGQHGSRQVVRYNSFTNVNWQVHGSEASYTRGGRCVEFYNNVMQGNGGSGNVLFFRSGTGLIHDNTITGWAGGGFFNLVNYTSQQNAFVPWGGPDGHNVWHSNNAANPFVTGTVTSAGTLTMTDSSKTWTLNQWQGYTITRTSGKTVSSLTRTGSTAYVTTSTAHGFVNGDWQSIWGADQYQYNQLSQVTVQDTTHFTLVIDSTPASPATGTMKCALGNRYSIISTNSTVGAMTWPSGVNGAAFALIMSVGDTYEINKIDFVMDQCGMGAGSLISVPLPSVPPVSWPDQVVSPLYEWNNGSVDFDNRYDYNGGTYATIVPNVHFFNDTAKPGYVAYTYPHPLVSGEAAPSSPSNFVSFSSVTIGSAQRRNPYFGQGGLLPSSIDMTDDLQRTLPTTYVTMGLDWTVWTNGSAGTNFYDAMYLLNTNYLIIAQIYNLPTNQIATFLPFYTNRFPLVWMIEPESENTNVWIVDRAVRMYRAALPNKILGGPTFENSYSAYFDEWAAMGTFTNLDCITTHDAFNVPGNGSAPLPPWATNSYVHPWDSPGGGYPNLVGRLDWLRSFTNLLRTNYPLIPKVIITEFYMYVSNTVDAATTARIMNQQQVPFILPGSHYQAGLTNSRPDSQAYYLPSISPTNVLWSPSMLMFLTNLNKANYGTWRVGL